jgi:formate hydrogenlyase subunit 6/NADH:ubiquinone oxidoreductase subunit I
MAQRARISIDYALCGDGRGVDPRGCGRCLRACGPAVFLMHETIGAVEPDPCDPRAWRVTPLWTSLCTRCMQCVDACPERAITVGT